MAFEHFESEEVKMPQGLKPGASCTIESPLVTNRHMV